MADEDKKTADVVVVHAGTPVLAWAGAAICTECGEVDLIAVNAAKNPPEPFVLRMSMADAGRVFGTTLTEIEKVKARREHGGCGHA